MNVSVLHRSVLTDELCHEFTTLENEPVKYVSQFVYKTIIEFVR